MTGKEAWALVAPMITPLLAVAAVEDKMVYDLYLTVYEALKEFDERRAGERNEQIN